MNGLNDGQNPGAIPLNTFMTVSATGEATPVIDNPSNVFEANFPAQPNGSGLMSTSSAMLPATIFGLPTKTVLIGAALLAVLLYVVNRKGN